MSKMLRVFDDGTAVVSVKAGKVFFILHFVSNTVLELAERKVTADGHTALTFKKDAILVVGQLHQGGLTAFHLFFARQNRCSEGRRNRLIWQRPPKRWPRLRYALSYVGVPRIYVCRGFGRVVTYADEVAVEDDRCHDGKRGWIIPRDIIGELFEALPSREADLSAA